MLILHISDLHLRDGIAGSSQDPDAHLRQALVTDAVAFCEKLGRKPDLVAISGDIAFAGSESEYRYATQWLRDLTSRLGIQLSQVFTIPGNHDVVRSTTKQTLVQLLHKEIRRTTAMTCDAVISNFLKDGSSGPLLYKSIEPYNDFAAQFLCSLYPPDRTLCDRRLPFKNGWTVRFLGVNSTFVSGENDKERDLFVDVAAKQILAEPGVINVVLCHHPYSWLAYGEVFADHLAVVSPLHLFGHVHTNRVELNRDFVKVSASAAHPDRQEHGWEPGYNLIELDLTGSTESPKLQVRVHAQVWQERPGQFRSKQDRNRADLFEQEILLEAFRPSVSDVGSLPQAQPTEDKESGILMEDVMQTLRNISLRFFSLTASQRSLLAGKLNLVEEFDKDLPEFERTRKILLRAKEQHLLGTLTQEMDEVIR